MSALEGGVAVVTGAASAMGRATAVLFAREGARVVAGDVDETAGPDACDEIQDAGGEVTFVRADVAVEVEVTALVATAERVYGALHTIFNNLASDQSSFTTGSGLLIDDGRVAA